MKFFWTKAAPLVLQCRLVFGRANRDWEVYVQKFVPVPYAVQPENVVRIRRKPFELSAIITIICDDKRLEIAWHVFVAGFESFEEKFL